MPPVVCGRRCLVAGRRRLHVHIQVDFDLQPLSADSCEEAGAGGDGAATFLELVRGRLPAAVALADTAGLTAVPALRESPSGAALSDITRCRAAFLGPGSESRMSADRLRFRRLLTIEC